MQTAFRIEANIPIPESMKGKAGHGVKPKSPLRQAIESLEVGESFLVAANGHKNTQGTVAGIAAAAKKATGHTFVTRKIDGGCRIWRTA